MYSTLLRTVCEINFFLNKSIGSTLLSSAGCKNDILDCP